MTYSWVSVDVKTGRVLNDFPDLTDGAGGVVTIAQTLGRYEIVSCSLPLPTAPPDWNRATAPYGSALILLADNPNDPSHGIPVWGGIVTRRVLDESDQVAMSLATAEAYFDRRFVGNKTYAATGQNTIVSDLVNSYIPLGVNGGLPIRVQVVTAGAGTTRDRTYADQDDKTVYSALTDLMGVQGGPEWYVGWEWQSNPERITPVLYVGDRIGSAAVNQPNAWFEMPGPVKQFQMIQDYSDGNGANEVVATSSGQGTTRPASDRQNYTDALRPTVEYRWTPSTSITDKATLNSWAAQALAQMKTGSTALALSAVASDPGCPQLGSDWFLGDDIGFNIGGLDAYGKDTVPAFPGGYTGIGRAIGYTLTVTETPILTPVLAGPQIFT